jgi:hypothetical protein
MNTATAQQPLFQSVRLSPLARIENNLREQGLPTYAQVMERANKRKHIEVMALLAKQGANHD